MKNVLIIPNPRKDLGLKITDKVVKKLNSLGISGKILNATRSEELLEKPDLVIVIGGDGSVIDASILAIQLDIPILGVNLGKVGYLSEVEPDAVKNLSRLVTGEYTVEKKI